MKSDVGTWWQGGLACEQASGGHSERRCKGWRLLADQLQQGRVDGGAGGWATWAFLLLFLLLLSSRRWCKVSILSFAFFCCCWCLLLFLMSFVVFDVFDVFRCCCCWYLLLLLSSGQWWGWVTWAWIQLQVGDAFWKDPSHPTEDNWVWSPQGEIQMHLPERWPNLWLRPTPVFHRPKQLELHDSTESKGGDSWCLETKMEKELFFLRRNGLYVRCSNDVARLVAKLSRWPWDSITQNKASFNSPLVGLTRTTWYRQRGFEHNQTLPRFLYCLFSRGLTMTQRSYLDTALHSLWSLLGENLTN